MAPVKQKKSDKRKIIVQIHKRPDRIGSMSILITRNTRYWETKSGFLFENVDDFIARAKPWLEKQLETAK